MDTKLFGKLMHQYQKHISDPRIPYLGISSEGKKSEMCEKCIEKDVLCLFGIIRNKDVFAYLEYEKVINDKKLFSRCTTVIFLCENIMWKNTYCLWRFFTIHC